MELRCFFFLLLCGPLSSFIYGQENIWVPQKHVTGYLTLEANYFNNLHFFQRDYAVSMPEAGLLIEYRLLKKMTFKGVFVYRPNWKLRDMISEASAEWTFSSYLKVKGGHLLTPLSPINTSFYAPLNLGVAMPMMVSHHDFYPISMEAVSCKGATKGDFKVEYDLFGGGYFNTVSLPNGAMGLFTLEDEYFIAMEAGDSAMDLSELDIINSDNLYYGSGIHLGFKYKEYVNVGFNFFIGNEKFMVPTPAEDRMVNLVKKAYGVNFKFLYGTLTLYGEVWNSRFDDAGIRVNDIGGSFIMLSNTMGEFTPYFKFENKTANFYLYSYNPHYKRYIVGVNYRPIFETVFKLEYFAYDLYRLNGLTMSVVCSF